MKRLLKCRYSEKFLPRKIPGCTLDVGPLWSEALVQLIQVLTLTLNYKVNSFQEVQLAFTSPKLTIKALEQGVKYVQS